MAKRIRSFLSWIKLAVIISVLVTACAPAPATTVVVQTVEVPVTSEVQVTTEVEVPVTSEVQVVVTATPAPLPPEEPATAEHPVELHVGAGLDASRMAVFLPAFAALDEAHPEWILVLDQAPGDQIEKISANIAAGTLPDVQEMSGVWAQQFIRQDAFVNLGSLVADTDYDLDDLYPWAAEEFTWNDQLYGIPFAAAPTLVYYNKTLFDNAGVAYPNDEWTFEDMRAAARRLTLDANGNNADSPNFDPDQIVQWGWGNTPGASGAWAHPWLEPFGCEFCAAGNCPKLVMTSPECLTALEWWADMVQTDHSAIYDPWSGVQTGIAGDPFISGISAMTTEAFFFIGQLAGSGIDYDITQPFLGPNDTRASAISTKGYAIAATSKHPQEAWRLIQELTSPEFVSQVWVQTGQSMSAQRSAGEAVLELAAPPTNLQAVIDTMEYAHPFRPNGPGAFEVYDKIWSLGMQAMSGEKTVEDAYTEAETIANEVLAENQ